MKKVIKSLTLLFAVAIVLISCEKEQFTEGSTQASTTSTNVEVTHNYTYENQHYSVTYLFDREENLISTGGDVKKHEALIKEYGASEKTSFMVEKVSEDGLAFDIRIFNSYEELEQFDQSSQPQLADKWEPCTNYRNNGSGLFKFYQHTNYVSEYTHLRRSLCSYFQQQWLDQANDNISSLEITYGAKVRLFDGSCYSGLNIQLANSVANLHYVHVGFFWFTPVYAGDFCASIKGYNY